MQHTQVEEEYKWDLYIKYKSKDTSRKTETYVDE
jgi:hypothetical protein